MCVATPTATPFVHVVATGRGRILPSRAMLAAPRRAALVQSVASIFVASPPFLPGASLFEHLFLAGSRATRAPCVYVSFAIAPNRSKEREVVSSMQKGVDQRTQGDSLKLVYLNIGDWKLHELF